MSTSIPENSSSICIKSWIAFVSPLNTVSQIIEWETMDIFTNSKNSAEIISLSENKTSLPYDKRVSFGWNDDEQVIINKILRNPSNSLSEIEARQRVLDELLSDRVNLEKLSEWKGESKSFWEALIYLWWYDRNEKEQAEREKRKSRKRIQVLKEENKKFTLENFIKIDDRLSKWLLNGEDFDEIIGRSHEILNLIGLKKDLTDINKFITLLKTISNPVIQDLAIKLETEYKQINFPSVSYFVQLYLDWKNDEINKLFTQTDSIYKILNQIWALISIASKIKEDSYTKVSFDETKPMQFKQAWQFERCKEKKWKNGDITIQKLNNSMDNALCNVLVWDIMSGKSFQWELNKQLHICAQSIWYAPANEVNIHIFDRFVSIDRALTDSWKWLSAFGEDITNINKLLELNSKWWKTFLFMDEWGSTTSPEDQAVLLKSILLYMTNKDIKVVLATHNEEFVKYIQDHEEFSTYHLEDRLNEDGTITFLYELKKWIWEHHILEAARTLWLPESICHTAEEYVKWNILTASIPEMKYRDVIKYTPEERERLKKERESFMSLMPYQDEIRIFYKKEARNLNRPFEITEFPVLKWRYSLDEDDKEERRNNWRWWEDKWYQNEEKPEYNQILSVISSDNEFRWAHFPGLKMVRHKEVWKFITQSPIRSSQDIFEIQKMWEELDSLWTEKLEQERIKLQNFLWHINSSLYTIRDYSENFNTKMFEEIYKEFIWDSFSWRNFVHTFRLFVLSIKISLDLSWEENNDFLTEQLTQFDLLIQFKQKIGELENKIEQEKKDWVYEKLKKKEFKIKQNENEKEYDQIIESCAQIAWFDLTGKKWIEIGQIITFWCKQIWQRLYDHFKGTLKPHNLFDIDLQIVKRLMDEEKEALSKHDWIFENSIRFICWLYNVVWQEVDIYSLTRELKKYDSIHLHQISHYWENILKTTLSDISNWSDIFELLKESYNSNKEPIKRSEIKQAVNFEKLIQDMFNLVTLVDISKMIKENSLCKVDFNETGSIVLDEPYNPNKKQEVKNRFYFWEDQRVVIKTGANMSGKTQSLKHTVWPLVFANAIGYAPAKTMTTPLIDKIYWVDRIKARQDLNLSSWGTEVIVLKEILEQISKSNWMNIGFFDEMWSTVPPSYQTALTYATVREFMQKWVYIDISHHNHDFIKKLTENHPEIVEPVHFKTNVMPDWTVSFDYKQERWHTWISSFISS